ACSASFADVARNKNRLAAKSAGREKHDPHVGFSAVKPTLVVEAFVTLHWNEVALAGPLSLVSRFATTEYAPVVWSASRSD
ncbi:MAG: hypothetical protein KDA92_27675, partial [Planctomycetales bacterium]|nr:hypothetical protein [Planctomycetales bacterium]